MIHVVLLSGGSGTRLWPLSNNSRSKQFLKVLRDEGGNHISMVQRVLAQVRRIPADVDVTIATSAQQRHSIESQLPEGGYELVLEPARRDTAPAIMLACAHLASEQGAAPGDTVVVMPIDAYAGQGYYDKVAELDAAVRAGAGDLVLMGVEPAYPSEKYGYIVPAPAEGAPRPVILSEGGAAAVVEGSPRSGQLAIASLPVARFQEKPSEQEAAALIAEGALWNCGVFAFRLGYLAGLTSQYVDARSYGELRARYGELPKNSFDYEVVERARSVAVVPYAGSWSDLGTWNTLAAEMADDASGRVIGVRSTCEGVHAINELGIPMVVTGLKDAVVVATHDGILVADKGASSHMKPLVERVAEDRPMYEQRRWGQYRVLDMNSFPDGRRDLVKELTVDAGCQLSYQLHRHRREVWTIVDGSGEVVLDGEVRAVSAGDMVDIPVGARHSCRAFEQMKIVEVQLGDLLEEEDIERFGDYWPDPENGPQPE